MFSKLHSYWLEHKRFVKYKHFCSNPIDDSPGVSQKSCLGPIIFLIFINDINSKSSVYFIFAYDFRVINFANYIAL